MANSFPPTLNTEVSGPNGNSSARPGHGQAVAFQGRSRSPARAYPGTGRRDQYPRDDGSVGGLYRPARDGRRCFASASTWLLLAIFLGAAAVTGSIPSAEEGREFGDHLGPFAAVAYVPLFASRTS